MALTHIDYIQALNYAPHVTVRFADYDLTFQDGLRHLTDENLENKEFITALKGHIVSLDDDALNTLIGAYVRPKSYLGDSLLHLRNTIFPIYLQAKPAHKVLMLKTLIAATELKLEPHNIQACKNLMAYQKEFSKFNFFRHIALAVSKFIAFFIRVDAMKRVVARTDNRIQLSAEINSYLDKPSQVFTYKGQHSSIINGARACSSIALTTAKKLGEGVPSNPTEALNTAVRAGIELNKAVSTGLFNRIAQKSVQDVEERAIEINPHAMGVFINKKIIPNILSDMENPVSPAMLNTASLALNTDEKSENKTTLDSILQETEAGRTNVAYVATSANIKSGKGHTISFFSNQVETPKGPERQYGIADSRHDFTSGKFHKGSLKLFNNKADFERSLLKTFCEDDMLNGKRDFVNINAYDMTRRKA